MNSPALLCFTSFCVHCLQFFYAALINSFFLRSLYIFFCCPLNSLTCFELKKLLLELNNRANNNQPLLPASSTTTTTTTTFFRNSNVDLSAFFVLDNQRHLPGFFLCFQANRKFVLLAFCHFIVFCNKI